MSEDFYKILGLNKDASEDEIKRAYRRLAQKHHPDRNKGEKASEEKFKEINKAYEVLSDKKKRQQYDQFGESAFGGGGGPGQGGGFDFGGFQGFGDSFSDIFESFFSGDPRGGRRAAAAAVDGEDLETTVTVSFEDAAFGSEKELKITRIAECQTCSGKGAAPGSKIVTCQICGGSGEIRTIRNTVLGQMSTRRVCDTCSGNGSVAERLCETCHGTGRVRVAENLRIKIPAGISDGSSIRVVGKGNAGLRGGVVGDLYVNIHVSSHKLFSRKGADVYSEIEIHPVQAALGDEVSVKTVHGPVVLRIPSGAQHGKIFKLKGHGVQKLRSESRGDHYVTIQIKTPEKLSKKQRELYELLAKEEGIAIHKEKGFFEKIMNE